MFAIIQSGGKQYKVAENDVIKVEKLAAEVGAGIDLDRVLMIGGEGAATIGTPLIDGALVTAEVLEQTRADKIIVFKKKRRKGYRRTKGHRQDVTVLRITDVTGKAKAAEKPAAEEVAPAAAPAAAPAEEAKPAAKKPAAKTTTTRKPAAKKAAPKKPAAKKPAAKAAPKKPAAKRTTRAKSTDADKE